MEHFSSYAISVYGWIDDHTQLLILVVAVLTLLVATVTLVVLLNKASTIDWKGLGKKERDILKAIEIFGMEYVRGWVYHHRQPEKESNIVLLATTIEAEDGFPAEVYPTGIAVSRNLWRSLRNLEEYGLLRNLADKGVQEKRENEVLMPVEDSRLIFGYHHTNMAELDTGVYELTEKGRRFLEDHKRNVTQHKFGTTELINEYEEQKKSHGLMG